MNLSSDSRSSLEELKQRNLPSETQDGEPPTPAEPMPETHPTAEEWDNLLAILSALYRLTAEEYDRAAEETVDPILRRMSGQLTALTENAAAIRLLLELEQTRQKEEQDGKKNGRRFSFRFPKISLPRPSPGWLFLPLILAASWALWYSLGALWSVQPILM